MLIRVERRGDHYEATLDRSSEPKGIADNKIDAAYHLLDNLVELSPEEFEELVEGWIPEVHAT